MTKQRQPNLHPISMFEVISQVIDGMLSSAQEQLVTLQPARSKPWALDDATVNRIIRVFTEQKENFYIFDGQFRHWRSLKLTAEQQKEISRLEEQMKKLQEINQDVLALATELSKGTIEKQLAKTDFELGLEMFLGKNKNEA